ncbi:phosphate ABC transporter permease PstA [Roseivivax isoporae]|nr:phosphate ABC transporter permease PstA [Roseivivax isoporae]
MTDLTTSSGGAASGQTGISSADLGLRRRHRKELRLKILGMAAILFAATMLFILLASIVSSGYKAFTQTHLELEIEVQEDLIPADNPARGDYQAMVEAALLDYYPDAADDERRAITSILSSGAALKLRDNVLSDPDLIGTQTTVNVPVSDNYDQLNKDLLDRDLPENRRRLDDSQIAYFDRLEDAGIVSAPINWTLVTAADSRFPELAGLKGALIGSFWALLVCFLISFPLGIGAAIYLEEFAKKNRTSDFIEVNINNLAAVPSVVFGLLALAVFLGWFGMPRSAPLVGGMTLALMTMPTIIISTRAALKAVPPSIREAALGVGASKHQVVFGHVLPLAMPGILTGTIIGLAQALGETAPLLLIGMNAFITSAPASPVDAATALPTQIYIWADSPERGFVSRTSAAIMVLLTFLVAMNALAIFLRSKFERRW